MTPHQNNSYSHEENKHDEFSSAHLIPPSPSHTQKRTPPQETPPASSNILFIKDLLFYATIALIIVIPVRIFIAQPFIVSGASMSPTFETGQYLIINQLSYHLSEPERFDVVVFRYPREPSKFFIKRIIGLPGETIEVRGNKVRISNANGDISFILEEPYVAPENTRQDFVLLTLKDDEYFVLGDNRKVSSDSRIWGPVSREYIVGKAFIRLLPISQVKLHPGFFRPDQNSE